MSKKNSKQYKLLKLNESDLHPDPIAQFNNWFDEASKSTIVHPHAMTLSTCSLERRIPSSRMVLLKGVDKNGFRFYTNRNSQKGGELSANPNASLCFWWEPLERQVRIDGRIESLPESEADIYFSTRPRGSQIGTWASDQSSVVESREILEKKFRDFEEKFKDKNIPRPDYWKGYVVVPETIEFWQGRPDRLHDRLRYKLNDNSSWIIERLAP